MNVESGRAVDAVFVAGSAGAVIVAAGAGVRFGRDKTFAPLGDQPVLAHSVTAFERAPAIGAIVVVLAAHNLDRGHALSRELGWRKVTSICAGGPRRQDSVRLGLERLPSCEWAIVHDGARPLVTRRLIDEGLATARRYGAAVAAVPAIDTVKMVDQRGIVSGTLDRRGLWLAQTPQVFRATQLLEAHVRCAEDVTDDAAVLERLGLPVAVYQGSYDNIKITTAEDLALAQWIVERRAERA